MTGKICGTGAYIPEKILDNEALSKLVDTSDEWIRSRTGIRRRHIAGEKETVAFMAGGEGGPSEREAKWKRGGTDPGSHDVGGGSHAGSGGPGPADHRGQRGGKL